MLNSTAKNLALVVVAGGLLAGTMATPSHAFGGGGGGGEGPEVRQNCHTAKCKHLDKKKVRKAKKARKARKKGRAWAQSHDPATGRTITSIGNGDGSRTVIGIGAGFGPIGIQIWTSP